TLAERLERGPMPLEETIDTCRQIAGALEAAHETGIIHRDLKPANVKLTPAGQVKVLDFGLAKGGGSGSASSATDLSQSPTIVPATTMEGVILGTAAYMSPEQARGKAVDKRTDVWAFGCVLYEMLAGRRAFSSDEVSDTLAFVITREVDWSALPKETPASIRRLLRRCLEKDRVPVAGGPTIPVSRSVGVSRGATWLPDDSIVFATTAAATGLLRVPSSGGDPKTITVPDAKAGEIDHLWPEALPGGHAVLF